MNATMQVHFMTKTNRAIARRFFENQSKSPSFLKFLSEKSLKKAEPDLSRAAVLPEQMTMEEYRAYLYDKIAGISMHPSQSLWHWQIEITDAGWEAMKRDASYESYVLRTIQSHFSAVDFYRNIQYVQLHFGAKEEEFYQKNLASANPMDEKEEGFWERREKRREKWREREEERLDKKAKAKQIAKEKHRLHLSGIRPEGSTGSVNGQTQSARPSAAYEESIFAQELASKLLEESF